MTIVSSSNEGSARRRRTPEETRALALDAAQMILVRDGPQALTLQAVAGAIGMTHGNLTHHFGAIAALHAALIVRLGEGLARDVVAATMRLRSGEASAREIVDLVFDALERDGNGRLVAWLSSTGQLDRLRPLLDVVSESVRTLGASPMAQDEEPVGLNAITAALLSSALAASLVGGPLQAATGLRSDGLRVLAARQLESLRAK